MGEFHDLMWPSVASPAPCGSSRRLSRPDHRHERAPRATVSCVIETLQHVCQSEKLLAGMIAESLAVTDVLGDHLDRGVPTVLLHLEKVGVLPPGLG
jgi:hypothetical protein